MCCNNSCFTAAKIGYPIFYIYTLSCFFIFSKIKKRQKGFSVPKLILLFNQTTEKLEILKSHFFRVAYKAKRLLRTDIDIEWSFPLLLAIIVWRKRITLLYAVNTIQSQEIRQHSDVGTELRSIYKSFLVEVQCSIDDDMGKKIRKRIAIYSAFIFFFGEERSEALLQYTTSPPTFCLP